MTRPLAVTLLLGALAVAPRATLQAQVGLVGGLASTSVVVNPADPQFTVQSHHGFAGGLGFAAKLSSTISLAPEALYVRGGFRDVGTQAGSTVSESTSLDALSIPVLLRIHRTGPGTRIFLVAGPEVDIRLSCSQDAGGGAMPCNTDAAPQGGFKSTWFAGVLGAGVEGKHTSLTVRYGFGLTNISRDTSAGAPTVKTHTLTAVLGVYFGR